MSDLVERARDILQAIPPAPWHTGHEHPDGDDEDTRVVEIYDADGSTVAEIRVPDDAVHWVRASATAAAALISASPTLLAELADEAETAAHETGVLLAERDTAVGDLDTARLNLRRTRREAKRLRKLLIGAGLDPDVNKAT